MFLVKGSTWYYCFISSIPFTKHAFYAQDNIQITYAFILLFIFLIQINQLEDSFTDSVFRILDSVSGFHVSGLPVYRVISTSLSRVQHEIFWLSDQNNKFSHSVSKLWWT